MLSYEVGKRRVLVVPPAYNHIHVSTRAKVPGQAAFEEGDF